MIEVKGLVKKYGNHVAVDQLSFTADKGQILGFLGPNGAGKSTTMNMLTGYISATEGSVTINGFDVYEEPEEAKKCIGYLPEIPPVYPDMTVEEYLKFVARMKKTEKSERNAMLKEIMEHTGVMDVKDRLIKHLSKGYRQRVGLAQALVGYPEVIILDEPTVGLDPMQIIEMRDLIKGLAEKHTVILSSHILSEISAVCDTIMIINKGKLIVSDTPENLTKYVKSEEGLQLTVRGSREQVEAILADIEGIRNVAYEEDTEGQESETTSFKLYEAPECDLRESLFYAMANAGCAILEMKTMSVTLEDIFLKVTEEDDKKQLKQNWLARQAQKRTKGVA